MSENKDSKRELSRIYDQGRYEIYEYRIDKAAKLEQFIEELTNETNSRLKKAALKDVGLTFRAPFPVNYARGKNYFNGYIGIHINFDTKEPDFLTSHEVSEFWLRLKELAKMKFKINKFSLNYYSINFEEESENEIYILNSKKEQIIKEGFENLENYVNWYVNAMDSYNDVLNSHDTAFNRFIKNLE